MCESVDPVVGDGGSPVHTTAFSVLTVLYTTTTTPSASRLLQPLAAAAAARCCKLLSPSRQQCAAVPSLRETSLARCTRSFRRTKLHNSCRRYSRSIFSQPNSFHIVKS